MGLSVGMNTYGSGTDTTDVSISISSDMGSLSFGSAQNSAADSHDNMPNRAGFGFAGTDTIVGKDYDDGDTGTGHGLQYTSPSISGWTIAASTGFSNTQGVDATTSVAVSGSIAGVSLAAGIAQIGAADTAAVEVAAAVNGVYTLIGTPLTPIVISNNTGDATDANSVAGAAALVEAETHRLVQAYTPAVATASAAVSNDHDDTFITASYQLGDISLGYGLYSSDAAAGDSASSISVSMPFAGMTAGIQYGEADNSGAAADDDGYRIGLVKSMGAGASFAVEYTDVTTGLATDDNPSSFRVGYMVSF
jgi:hypothetical protein